MNVADRAHGTRPMAIDIADRVLAARGQLLALDLDEHTDELIAALRTKARDLDNERSEVHIRLVLGSACSTAVEAVTQLVAALQLPYSATRGWSDLLGAVNDRVVTLREVVVVADAADLLRHEDAELWEDLVACLRTPPGCFGGGWNTLVLVDADYRWRNTRFGSVAGVEAAVRHRRA